MENQHQPRQPPSSLEAISQRLPPISRKSLKKYKPQKKKAAIAQAAPEKLQTYFLQTSSFPLAATLPYQWPESFTVRRRSRKSTYVIPKRWLYPSAHSKLSSRLHAW